MSLLLRAHRAACVWIIGCLLRLAAEIDDHHRRFAGRIRGWQRRVRRLYERWLVWRGCRKPPPFARGNRPWNKTPDHLEEQVVRLHVEQPHLGAGQLRWLSAAGQLRWLSARVLGFVAARETFRQILIRRRQLVMALEDERRNKPRRIRIARPRLLWGADLTLVWMLGILPVWILGIVDYHGSRLVCLERMHWWPTAAQVATAFDKTVAEHGAPARLLTDRAPVLRAADFERVLSAHGTRHVLIKPCHAWTNGRIERVFRTYKETVFRHAGLWLFKNAAHIDRYCAEFLVFYNRDRPHSAYAGRTPDEVYFGRRMAQAPLARVSYFDGRLQWYRFG